MTYKKTQPLALTLIASASLLALTCAAQAAEESETRDLPSFSEITAKGSSDVEVTIGEAQSVTVYGEADELVEIITEVKGDKLIIRRKDSKKGGFFSRNHNSRVVITVPSLTDFTTKGSGDGSVSGISGDHFEIGQYGSGDVEVEGSAQEANIRSDGSGDLDADSFTASQLMLNSRGSGDMSFGGLSATKFTYKTHGSGDLDVDGTCATFSIDSMGSGEIDAQGLQCTDVSISSMGSGEISIFATGDISVEIMGSGDVDIYGGGKLTHSRTHGSGDVDIHN